MPPKNRKNGELLSHQLAAEMAGVTRKAISKMQLTRSFFTEDGKVDSLHPDWLSYLKEKTAQKENAKKREGYRTAKKSPDDFNWINETPTTIQEEKIYADIIQKKISIMQDLDQLIDRNIVVSAFGEIIKAIQSNFVDHGRRVSPIISAKLGLPGTEKTIEKIENEEQKRNIENVIAAVRSALKKI